MSSKSNRKRCVILSASALAFMPLAGCYERVVSAQGLGATGVMVQQPSVKDRTGHNPIKVQEMRVAPNRTGSKPW